MLRGGGYGIISTSETERFFVFFLWTIHAYNLVENLLFPCLVRYSQGHNIEILPRYRDLVFFIFWKSKNWIVKIPYIPTSFYSDNYDFFCYKYKTSNKIKDKFKNLSKNFENLNQKKFFLEKNIKKLIYFYGKSNTLDLIIFSKLQEYKSLG